MDGTTLVNFPLPMMTALLCAAIALLIWRVKPGNPLASAMFSALFALCALETLFVGLRFGYGVDRFIPLQRTLPLFLGPLMYLGFVAMTVGRQAFAKRAAVHLGAPIIAMGLFWLLVDDLRHLDWLIGASYLTYIVALFLLWRKGPDALSHARLDAAHALRHGMVLGMGLLGFILLLDTAIALDFALNRGSNAPRLISLGTVPLVILLLVILGTLPLILTPPRTAPKTTPGAADKDIEARLRRLMHDDQLFLDPELSVQRLAKRLHLPARNLSAAINSTQGMNVSQYVNEFRLARATDLLIAGNDSVTKIAEQSGFLTRSNFYREFQRVHGQSPTDYRIANRPA